MNATLSDIKTQCSDGHGKQALLAFGAGRSAQQEAMQRLAAAGPDSVGIKRAAEE